MGPASIALSGVGTFLDMKGKAQATGAQAGEYQYKSAVAKINQQIAKQNADYERHSGEVKAQQRGMQTRANIGSVRAKQGASGLDVNKGSTVKVRESIADIGAQDVGIIRSNAARRAYAYETEAANLEAQGTIYDAAAKNTLKAGKISQWQSLISGASNIAGKFQAGAQSGLWSTGGNGSSNLTDGASLSWETA